MASFVRAFNTFAADASSVLIGNEDPNAVWSQPFEIPSSTLGPVVDGSDFGIETDKAKTSWMTLRCSQSSSGIVLSVITVDPDAPDQIPDSMKLWSTSAGGIVSGSGSMSVEGHTTGTGHVEAPSVLIVPHPVPRRYVSTVSYSTATSDDSFRTTMLLVFEVGAGSVSLVHERQLQRRGEPFHISSFSPENGSSEAEAWVSLLWANTNPGDPSSQSVLVETLFSEGAPPSTSTHREGLVSLSTTAASSTKPLVLRDRSVNTVMWVIWLGHDQHSVLVGSVNYHQPQILQTNKLITGTSRSLSLLSVAYLSRPSYLPSEEGYPDAAVTIKLLSLSHRSHEVDISLLNFNTQRSDLGISTQEISLVALRPLPLEQTYIGFSCDVLGSIRIISHTASDIIEDIYFPSSGPSNWDMLRVSLLEDVLDRSTSAHHRVGFVDVLPLSATITSTSNSIIYRWGIDQRNHAVSILFVDQTMENMRFSESSLTAIHSNNERIFIRPFEHLNLHLTCDQVRLHGQFVDSVNKDPLTLTQTPSLAMGSLSVRKEVAPEVLGIASLELMSSADSGASTLSGVTLTNGGAVAYTETVISLLDVSDLEAPQIAQTRALPNDTMIQELIDFRSYLVVASVAGDIYALRKTEMDEISLPPPIFALAQGQLVESVVSHGDWVIILSTATSGGHSTVTILSLTFVSLPSVLSVFSVSDGAADIAVSDDDTLFVVGDDVLEAFDISEEFLETGPRKLDSFRLPEPAKSIVVSSDGHAAFVSAGRLLLVFDTSDVSSCTLVAEYHATDLVSSATVSGDWLYVCDGTAGLVVVNVGTASLPALETTLPLSGPAKYCAIDDNGETVFVGTENEFVVVDPAAWLAVEWTPSEVEAGTYHFRVGCGHDVLSFSLHAGNSRPHVGENVYLPDALVMQKEHFSMTLQEMAFVDVDADSGDTITLLVSSVSDSGELGNIPTWLTFDGDSRTLSGTPLHTEDLGTTVVSFSAVDSTGATSLDSLNFALTVKSSPRISETVGMDDLTVRVGESFHIYIPEGLFLDDDGDSLTYSARLINGDPLPRWITFDSVLRRFHGTGTLNGADNVYRIFVFVTDVDGKDASSSFQLTVVNTAPSPNPSSHIPHQLLQLGVSYDYTLPSDIFSDVDVDSGDKLRFSVEGVDASLDRPESSWSHLPLPNWLSFDPITRLLSGTPVEVENLGEYTFSVSCHDVAGFTASNNVTFAMTVKSSPRLSPVNEMEPLLVNVGESFTYQIPETVFLDDDGDSLTFSAHLMSGYPLPHWMTFEPDDRLFRGVALLEHADQIEHILVTAVDMQGWHVSGVWSCEIRNAPPRLSPFFVQPSARVIFLGESFEYTVPKDSFVDDNQQSGDEISNSVHRLGKFGEIIEVPEWVSVTSEEGELLLQGTPTSISDLGRLNLFITARDTSGATGNDRINVDLLVKSTPRLSDSHGMSDLTVHQGERFRHHVPAGLFLDDDGDSLTYSARLINGDPLPRWITFDSVLRRFHGTGTLNGADNVYRIFVFVTDVDGKDASSSFQLTVVNTPPHVNYEIGIGEMMAVVGTKFNFQIPSDAFLDGESAADFNSLVKSSSVRNEGLQLVVSAYHVQSGRIDSLPNWLSLDSDAWIISGEPTTRDIGSFGIDLAAVDACGEISSDHTRFTIRVKSSPRVSETVVMEDLTVRVGESFEVFIPEGLILDDDGDVLTYSARLISDRNLPDWITFDTTSKRFYGRVPHSIQTPFFLPISIDVEDGHFTLSYSWAVFVSHGPGPYVARYLPDQWAFAGASIDITMPNDVYFPRTSVSSDAIALEVHSWDSHGFPACLSAEPSKEGSTQTSLSLRGVCHHTVDMFVVVSVQVLNQHGERNSTAGTSYDRFRLRVAHNQPPVQTKRVEDKWLVGGDTLSYYLGVLFQDEEGEPCELQVYLRDLHGRSTDWLSFNSNDNTISGTAPLNRTRTVVVEIVAVDPAGATSTTSFTVFVLLNLQAAFSVPPTFTEAQQPFKKVIHLHELARENVTTSVARVDAHSIRASDGARFPLPPWLVYIFNRRNADTEWSVTFVGYPPFSPLEIETTVLVAAFDDEGELVDFSSTSVSVQPPTPKLRHPVPAQSVKAGQPWSLTLPIQGGDAGLRFSDVSALVSDKEGVGVVTVAMDPPHRWLSLTFGEGLDVVLSAPRGIPTGDYNITVQCRTQLSYWDEPRDVSVNTIGSSSNALIPTLTVDLTVSAAPNLPPVVLRRVENAVALSGTEFVIPVSPSTFLDADDRDESVAVSARQARGAPLPSYLRWDSELWQFVGDASAPAVILDIVLEAEDPLGAMGSTDFVLDIRSVNHPPTPTTSNVTMHADLYRFAVKELPTNMFLDQDGDDVAFTCDMSEIPDKGLQFDSDLQVFLLQPSKPGSWNVVVNAIDVLGASSQKEFTLIVDRVTDAVVHCSVGSELEMIIPFSEAFPSIADVLSGSEEASNVQVGLVGEPYLEAWLVVGTRFDENLDEWVVTLTGTPSASSLQQVAPDADEEEGDVVNDIEIRGTMGRLSEETWIRLQIDRSLLLETGAIPSVDTYGWGTHTLLSFGDYKVGCSPTDDIDVVLEVHPQDFASIFWTDPSGRSEPSRPAAQINFSAECSQVMMQLQQLSVIAYPEWESHESFPSNIYASIALEDKHGQHAEHETLFLFDETKGLPEPELDSSDTDSEPLVALPALPGLSKEVNLAVFATAGVIAFCAIVVIGLAIRNYVKRRKLRKFVLPSNPRHNGHNGPRPQHNQYPREQWEDHRGNFHPQHFDSYADEYDSRPYNAYPEGQHGFDQWRTAPNDLHSPATPRHYGADSSGQQQQYRTQRNSSIFARLFGEKNAQQLLRT